MNSYWKFHFVPSNFTLSYQEWRSVDKSYQKPRVLPDSPRPPYSRLKTTLLKFVMCLIRSQNDK